MTAKQVVRDSSAAQDAALTQHLLAWVTEAAAAGYPIVDNALHGSGFDRQVLHLDLRGAVRLAHPELIVTAFSGNDHLVAVVCERPLAWAFGLRAGWVSPANEALRAAHDRSHGGMGPSYRQGFAVGEQVRREVESSGIAVGYGTGLNPGFDRDPKYRKDRGNG